MIPKSLAKLRKGMIPQQVERVVASRGAAARLGDPHWKGNGTFGPINARE